ncbi:MAG: hypothetical protein ACI4XL_03435 [Bacillus sp. (in: firmicutes)]
MSLKLIELQIAIPRTQEAGRLQEQLLQQAQSAKDGAVREMQKQAEKDAKSVLRKQMRDELNLNDSHQLNLIDYTGKGMKQKETEDCGKNVDQGHPYKGRAVDFSG